MTELAQYCFTDFVADLEMITSAEHEEAEIIRRISRKMKLLLTSGDSILTDEEREANAAHYNRHLVYIDRKRRFVIMGGVWLPGQGTPIHDHGTWGVMGILEGELKVTNYLRLDDRSKPGFAKLRESTGSYQGAGGVSYILPPSEEIHKVENVGEKTTYSMHVYGRDVVEFNMYDLEKGTVGPYMPDYNNCPSKGK